MASNNTVNSNNRKIYGTMWVLLGDSNKRLTVRRIGETMEFCWSGYDHLGDFRVHGPDGWFPVPAEWTENAEAGIQTTLDAREEAKELRDWRASLGK